MKIIQLLGAFALLGSSYSYAVDTAKPEIATLVKIDDFSVTNLHFAIFNAQNPAKNSGNPQQQIALLNELVNTFMVANSVDGKALEKNPEITAALEVAKARLIAQALIRDRLQNGEVTEAALQAAYKAEYDGQTSHEYKARHILLENEADATAVIAELNNGTDFIELAKSKSTGPSKSVGGDLGWFSLGLMTKDFSAALAKLEDGKYSSSPVKTQFGWHIILREATKEVPAPTLNDVRKTLAEKIRSQNLALYIRAIRDNSKIDVQTGEASIAE